ncbi:hypothetical protein HN51_047856, partial [Arachis hypogaea]
MKTASSDQTSKVNSSFSVSLLLWDHAVMAKKLLLTASQHNPARLNLFCSETPPVSAATEFTPQCCRRSGACNCSCNFPFITRIETKPDLRFDICNPDFPLCLVPWLLEEHLKQLEEEHGLLLEESKLLQVVE